MILYIQTIAKQHELLILDEVGKVRQEKKWVLEQKKNSEITLQYIEEICRDFNISKIIVMTGMGSYTGTRIAVSLANALAFGWNIPIAEVYSENYEGDNEKFTSATILEKDFSHLEWKEEIKARYIQEPRVTIKKTRF